MVRYTDTISGEELYVHDDKYGNKFYYKDRAMTICHRLDGPAAEWKNGTKLWYANGKQHRLDGPAIEHADGDKDWYVNNVYIMMLDKNGKIKGRME